MEYERISNRLHFSVYGFMLKGKKMKKATFQAVYDFFRANKQLTDNEIVNLMMKEFDFKFADSTVLAGVTEVVKIARTKGG